MSTPGRGPALPVTAAVAALALLLAGQALLERSFERRWPRRQFESLIYLPSGPHLKAMSLGFTSAYADFLWMRAIGYFGGHTLTDREYPWFHHILDQVTTLDPPFRYPYLFGGIALAVTAGRAEESVRILEKGMEQYPGDWRFPFYLGFDYFFYLRDPARAAVAINLARSLPESPGYLPRLAASLMAGSGQSAAAIRFLETLAEGTRDEGVRADIRSKIDDLRAGRIPQGLRGILSGQEPP